MMAQHLDAVIEIERAAHSHPWAESLLRDLNGRGACHHVLTVQDEVVGYFYAQNIVGEVTLLNLAVAPKAQGQGFGQRLLTGFIEQCDAASAESAWLEVRESNHTAIALYQQAGFNEIDRRRGYYPTSNGKEDAIIMSMMFFSFA
ncbi:ribosomal protein S18-alanine N-acetyltransferase [Vibrio sp. SM6]|uniref:[Ribosomal protein bS18]-alanine N-acetyltransferase n=2 Tax=Vibrio agarilyticus TaxID=2726741 RepID=A0A7X8TQ15_9VIBR|nr:ribosomal protein S18-alanine N-acetyltransferase [Vibrio agarilyticus]